MSLSASVYIFDILLDVFIIFTIFAIYLYVLFRFFIHSFEEMGLTNFFKIHLGFYQPMIKLFKLSSYNRNNPTALQQTLNDKIESISAIKDTTDYSIATYSILGFILGQFVILCIYFMIFRKNILAQLNFATVIAKIFINAVFILLFELLFLFFVYGNSDLFSLVNLLDLDST